MTNEGVVQVLEDGTHVYADGRTYLPVPPEQRKYGVNKPADPRAVRYHGIWVLPIDVQPDSERVMPPTRTDEEAYDHAAKRPRCRCEVCSRPEALRWRAKWQRQNP